MQHHYLSSVPSLANPHPSFPDPSSTMSDDQPSSSPIHYDNEQNNEKDNKSTHNGNKTNSSSNNNDGVSCNNNIVRRERPSRACTARSSARLYAAAAAEAAITAAERKRKATARRERKAAAAKEEENGNESEEEQEDGGLHSTRNLKQGGKIVTPLVGEPGPSQLPRWSIRSMWELASILNFLNVFRPILNIKAEFSVEEFETALLAPNNTLADIHMPLLKAIPPITRMALGHNTWVTVLCRKLRDWWHWVAEGELPIVVSHGAEFDAYNALNPGVRLVILKALCDIRSEQEDIRNHIDDSLKTGYNLSTFRKERIGGDSHGISYWYEDDPVIGHRLYREIRKVEVKKRKGKTAPPIPSSCYQWETVATNLDEFQDISDKLLSSKSRTEASVGKKLKNDMLPEIERVHKRKEKLLKKQHRQALLLDSVVGMDGLASGRSLRDRKHVTYTFDDYERSINEAIKITKCKEKSPEHTIQKESVRHDGSINGKWGGPSQMINHVYFNMSSPRLHDYDKTDENLKPGPLERSNRRRQRPQRYSAKEFVEAVSDNDTDLDSDDEIVGEAVYDEEYLRRQKHRRKMSSSSEGDEEYQWDEYNAEEEEEEEDDDSSSLSEDSNESQTLKTLPVRTRRETKLRSVDELQSGLRRSKRATRNHINYSQYVMSESENESLEPEKSNASDEHAYASDNSGFSTQSQDFEPNDNDQEIKVDEPVQEHRETAEKEQIQLPDKLNSPSHDEFEGPRRRRFLDLNELAPGSCFDDGPNSMMKDEDKDEF